MGAASDNWLSESDTEKIMLAMAFARTGKAFNDDDAGDLCRWASQALVNYHLVQLILKGQLLADWSGKDVIVCKAEDELSEADLIKYNRQRAEIDAQNRGRG